MLLDHTLTMMRPNAKMSQLKSGLGLPSSISAGVCVCVCVCVRACVPVRSISASGIHTLVRDRGSGGNTARRRHYTLHTSTQYIPGCVVCTYIRHTRGMKDCGHTSRRGIRHSAWLHRVLQNNTGIFHLQLPSAPPHHPLTRGHMVTFCEVPVSTVCCASSIVPAWPLINDM